MSAEDEYQSGIADATAKRLTASEVIRATAEGLGLDPELMTLPPSVGKPTVPGTTWQESMGIEPEYRHGDDDPIVQTVPLDFYGQPLGVLLELHESGNVTWRNP